MPKHSWVKISLSVFAVAGSSRSFRGNREFWGLRARLILLRCTEENATIKFQWLSV
jgi:hypothetical protein